MNQHFGSEYFGNRFGDCRSEQEVLTSPETRLLLLAAMPTVPDDLGFLVEQAVGVGLDWTRFEAAAIQHRLLPFASRSLSKLDEVPLHARRSLREATRKWAMRSLGGAADARRLTIALDHASIPNLNLKGPALSQQLYGGPAARMFVDIDVFVQPEDFAGAVKVATKLGYRTESHSDWSLDQVKIATRAFHAHDVAFRPAGDGLRLELHWRAFGHTFYDHGEAALLAALRQNDSALLTVSSATQVLVHGAIHGYRRLGWLRDAAALCTTLDDAQWEGVLRLADLDHAPNAVLLGPYLAHRLFNVALPDLVADRIEERSDTIRRTAGLSSMARPAFPGVEEPGAFRFQLLLRDRFRDRLSYGVDKIWWLDAGSMTEKTLRNGPRGRVSRLAAQPKKFSRFCSRRLAPRVVRGLRRRKQDSLD